MKEIITKNFFKILLIIAFIGLAFYQWKNEKVFAIKSDADAIENITATPNDEVPAEPLSLTADQN